MFKNQERILIIVVLFVGIIGLSLDILDDLGHGAGLKHIVGESVVVFFCSVALIVLARKYFQSKSENLSMRENLETVKADLDHYKQETQHLSKGLHEKIENQMNQWGFTTAEKEVCWLLLKGLAIKEISDVRSTSEKTIKQQLNSIYQKSNLSGRAELSAFFLEDLFIS